MFDNMNQTIIVTNLRLPKEDWLETRAIAGEMGISVNELIKRALSFFASYGEKSNQANDSFWEIPKLAKMKNKPLGPLSSDDEAIYG